MTVKKLDDGWGDIEIDMLHQEGNLIAYQEWDSGIMTGLVELYKYKETFFVIHEAGIDSYDDPKVALKGSGIANVNDATRSIQIDWKKI